MPIDARTIGLATELKKARTTSRDDYLLARQADARRDRTFRGLWCNASLG
jgi:hypothetical protein